MNRTSIFGIRLFVLLTAAVCMGQIALAEAGMKALIVTGQNNHDWKMSSPILKQILENTGLFRVDLATSPEGADGMSDFAPDFKSYRVVVLDYSGLPWPESTRAAFVQYVSEGGGVVVYHAADNSFPEWPEFNQIIGLGGWGDRNEKSGPYIRWRDGGVVRDTSPGPGGSHGKQHAFAVTVRDKTHPITKGLPEVWMHGQDELYDRLRGPAQNMTLLATAYSAPEQNGTGEHEPVLFTISYGTGRIFHTVLGHAGGENPPPAMQCVGFIVTLQRGAEWAATGTVTQSVPADFPTATETRFWKDYRSIPFSELLSRISGYTFNASLEPIVEINAALRGAISQRKAMGPYEKEMLGFLRTNASRDSKYFVCKKLSEVGSSTSASTLALLMNDPQTVDMARYALERIPGEAIGQVLRESLLKASDRDKAGIITSLGVRKDRKSVAALSGFLQHSDPVVSGAAVAALVQIGDDAALASLWAARDTSTGALHAQIVDACLQGAANRLSVKRYKEAAEWYKSLMNSTEPVAVRTAAIRGLVWSKGAQAGPEILELLKAGDPSAQAAAIGSLGEVTSRNVLVYLAKELPNLPINVQTSLLSAFAKTGDHSLASMVLPLVEHTDPDLKVAAILTLGMIGNGDCVGVLAKKASIEGAESVAALDSLNRLCGADVDAALISGIERADTAAERAVLIRVVSMRPLSAAGPVLIGAASDSDAGVRLAAIEGLRAAGGAEQLGGLITLLLHPVSPEDRPAIESTLFAVAKRNSTNGTSIAPLLAALPSATDVASQKSLLLVLGRLGDASALPALESSLRDARPEIRSAAISALSEWPNSSVRGLLMEVLRQGADTSDGKCALTGVVRLLSLSSDAPMEEIVKGYEEVLGLATDPEQKELVIAGLAGTKHATALPLLYNALDAPDDAVKTAAIKALSDWPDGTPLAAIRSVAHQATNETHKILALRGMVRLNGLDKSRPAEQSAALYQEAMTLAPNAEVQKAVLSGLSTTMDISGLRIAAESLANETLHEEAEVAAVKIAKSIAGAYPQEVKGILTKVVEKTQLDYVRQEGNAILGQIKQYESYLTAWEVSGPYMQEGATGTKLFDMAFGPESSDSPPMPWEPICPGMSAQSPYVIALDKWSAGNNRVAYLRTRLWSEQAQTLTMELGSDDGVRVWHDGKEIFANNATRPLNPRSDTVKMILHAGWNALLVKVTQNGGEWSFCARLTKEDGGALDAPLRTETGPVRTE